MPNIYLSAGEASGDRHASALAKAILERSPDSTVFGMGGGGMRASGVEITQGIDELAVMGFTEVLARLPKFTKVMSEAVESCRARAPDVAVLVDYPAFHLKLARKLKDLGCPVVLYIAPQVWAWRPGRVRTVARVATKMLVIFEFEVPIFREAGVDVDFVGHPLLDEIDTEAPGGEARRALGLDGATPLLAILPGSRRQVWRRLLPVYVDAVKQVRRVRPEVTAAVGTPDGTPAMFGGEELTLPPVVKTHDLLRDATAGMYNSGTMSLEAAILGCPGVVGYKMNWFNYQIAKQVVKLPYVALPNIVLNGAGRDREPDGTGGLPDRVAMRELVQHELTSATAASEMLSFVAYPERREEARALLREVRGRLGAPGASGRAADAVLGLLS